MAQDTVTIGELIEFKSADDHRIGVILAEIGKKKLDVITAEGDQMRPTRKDVTLQTGVKVADVSPQPAQAAARRFADKVDQTADEIDVPMVWEFVREGDEALTPDELADLYFGEITPANSLAVLRVLRADIVYFRQKKGRRDEPARFEPRPADLVEEMQRQLEAELEKKRERDAFIERMSSVLGLEEPAERSAAAHQEMADPEFRRLAHLLQDYAVYDDEFERADQANELLDQIQEQRGRPLRGSRGLRAFGLMVKLGLWDKHENLHLLRHQIATEAAPEIISAAGILAEKGWGPEPWREDLSAALTLTIDDESTRDIDDALSVEELGDGRVRIGVHIADPSARIPADSAVDADARSRGTSIYLPTGVFPMFPALLSHHELGLIQDELRPAMSALFEFGADGRLLDTKLAASIVRVDRRQTYQAADEFLSRAQASGEDAAIIRALKTLDRLSRALRERREEHGAVSINLPDLDLQVDFVDEEPQILCTVIDAQSAARNMVSEWMIANNQAVGDFSREHSLPSIFRGQPAPDEELFTSDILSVPEGVAREFALIRKMKPGDISSEPRSHFGLGLSTYVQASSPIRRYSDLACQRQVKALLAGKRPVYDENTILEVLGAVESSARQAKITERETERYWTLEYLAGLKGQPLQATVVEHKDHNPALAGIFLHNVAMKVTCKFTQRPEVGQLCEVTVLNADGRKDALSLRQA